MIGDRKYQKKQQDHLDRLMAADTRRRANHALGERTWRQFGDMALARTGHKAELMRHLEAAKEFGGCLSVADFGDTLSICTRSEGHTGQHGHELFAQRSFTPDLIRAAHSFAAEVEGIKGRDLGR